MKKDLKKVNLGFILQDPKNAGRHNVCTYMSMPRLTIPFFQE